MFKAWSEAWRGERGGWWRLIAALAGYLAGLLAFGTATIAVIEANRPSLEALPEWQKEIAEQSLIAISFLGGLIGFFVAKSFLHRGRPGVIAAPEVRVSIGSALLSGVVWTILITASAIVLGRGDVLAERIAAYPPAIFAALGAMVLFAVAIQGASEEIVFRGYLLPRLAAWMGVVGAILVSTLIFLGLHFQPGVWGAGMIALYGLAFALSTVRFASIMPAVGMHVANNSFEFLFFPEVTNAERGQQDFITDSAMIAIWLVVMFLVLPKGRAR